MRESNPHLLLNSGIEPEFNLFWRCEGNQTLKVKTRYVGDGYKNGKHVEILRFVFYLFGHKRIFYVGNRTLKTYLVMVKSFWKIIVSICIGLSLMRL